MHHAIPEIRIHVQERLPTEPVKEVCAIWRVENGPERVRLPEATCVFRGRQEVNFVVAQHQRRRRPKRTHEAQHVERLGPAVDEVPDQPEPVVQWIEPRLIEQGPQLFMVTLDVAYRIYLHERTLRPGRQPRSRSDSI